MLEQPPNRSAKATKGIWMFFIVVSFKNRLNIRLNAQNLNSQRSIKLNTDNIRLRSNTIKIINQGMPIDHTYLNVLKD